MIWQLMSKVSLLEEDSAQKNNNEFITLIRKKPGAKLKQGISGLVHAAMIIIKDGIGWSWRSQCGTFGKGNVQGYMIVKSKIERILGKDRDGLQSDFSAEKFKDKMRVQEDPLSVIQPVVKFLITQFVKFSIWGDSYQTLPSQIVLFLLFIWVFIRCKFKYIIVII